MLNFLQRQDQVLFLDSSRIRGVQNLDFQYEVGSENVVGLSSDSFSLGVNGEQIGQFNVSTSLISLDQLISYTGESHANGYLLKNRNNKSENYSFTSGYLTNYSSRCSVGEIPQTNASFRIFGNLGRLSESDITHFNNIQTGVDQILTKTSFSEFVLTLNDFNVQHVISYDININVDRRPDYALGSRYPRRVVINWPIDISISFVVSASEYHAYALRDYPQSKRKTNIFLGIKEPESQIYISSYSFDQMTLISENYSSDVNSKSTVTLVYKMIKGKEELVRDGLVFYLNTLNQNMYSSAELIKDSTFNKIDFILTNNENSPHQSCLGFNGLTSRGVSSRPYKMKPSLTFMSWIFPGLFGDDHQLFAFGDTARHGVCTFQDLGVPIVSVRVDFTLYAIGDVIPNSIWSFVCFVFDGENNRVHYYLNGELINSIDLVSPIEDSSENYMYLGSRDSQDFYYGSVAKTILYDRVLTSEEIARNYRVTSDCRGINDTF